MLMAGNVMASRRDFLKSCGALVVAFSSASFFEPLLHAQGPFDTHSSHIDPKQLDSWLAVNSDGTVTAYTGKCDFGQGIFTAQTQLVAEELCVSLGQVKLIQCDTDETPDQGTTSGSQSTPTNFNHEGLALAAATAREALLNIAAARLGESVELLAMNDGRITSTSGQTVTYQELLKGQHFNIPLNGNAKRRAASQWTILGKAVPSLDRQALMAGQFEFVHSVRLPDLLHGRVVRPPGMGAKLAHVDESSIQHIPGVVKIVVRKDFVGVVAESQHQATRAAQALKIEWDPGPALPPQETFFDYLQRQPSRDVLSVDSGDTERQLANANNILKARYTYPYQMHGSLGASCAVADVKAGHATIWSATQSAYPTRNVIAKLLDLSPDNVRVIYTRGSGCYGLNGADAVSFDAAVLSHAVGKPVRLQFSREDEMKWENLGAACVIEHRAALSSDGNIVVWDRENWVASLGGRPGYNRPENIISGMLMGYELEKFTPSAAKPLQGKLRNQSNHVPSYFAGCIGDSCDGGGTIRAERALTHTVRSPFFTGPLRSPLRIQNTFATECFMDELCIQAKADPVEFRLRHLRDSRVIAVLKAAAKAANWKPRLSLLPSHIKSQERIGRGVACLAYEGKNGYAALVAEVSVNMETGVVHPTHFVIASDCGPISNPDGLRNQIEGGLLQGVSRSLIEEISWDERHITSIDWQTYKTLYLDYKPPSIEIVFVTPENVPATGAGETAITLVPAAIGNAICDATGVRLRDVPFRPQRVLGALHKSGSSLS
jgi:nicotinate dehydrogenase subunit B